MHIFLFIPKGSACVDTGAQYIHGATDKNPVYFLLKKSGLLSQVPEDGSEKFYNNKGQEVDADLTTRVYEAGERILLHHGSNTGKSLGEHFAEKTKAVIDSLEDDETKIRMRSVFALVGKDMLIDIGASDLHSVSLDSWEYYTHMGDNLDVPGYGKIFKCKTHFKII